MMSPEPADDSAPTTLPLPWPAPIPAAAAELVTLRPDAPDPDVMSLILAGLKPASAAGYMKDYHDFAKFIGSPAPAPALARLFRQPEPAAAAAVLAYRADMEDRKLASATVARRLSALKHAVKRGRAVGLTRLTLDAIDIPKTEAYRDVRGPGAKGFKRMLDRAEQEAGDGTPRTARDLCILMLLYYRALRRSEVTGIDLADVRLDPGAPAVAVLGKGKNNKEFLSINEPTRLAIARYLKLRGEAPGALFLRADRGRSPAAGPDRMDPESVNRLIKALARRCKLTQTVRAHGLRHASITAALDSGFSARDVRVFSRHSKLETLCLYDDRREDLGGVIGRELARPRRGGGRKSA